MITSICQGGQTAFRMAALALLSLLTASASGNEPSPGGSVRVTIRPAGAAGANTIGNAYVAAVRHDQPLARPTAETIATAGEAELSLPAGTYVLVTAADGFRSDRRDLRIAEGQRSDVAVELSPSARLRGVVVDQAGKPVEGAGVRNGAVVPELPPLTPVSAVAQRHLARMLETTTDERGEWELPALVDTGASVLVEAPGFAPAAVTDQASIEAGAKTVLRSGARLVVNVDRTDAEVEIALVPAEQRPADAWQPMAWSRRAGTSALQWDALPAGDFTIVARHSDPLRFITPQVIGRVRVNAGEQTAFSARLPKSTREPATSYLSFLVPEPASRDFQGFARRRDGGVNEVAVAVAAAIAGDVVHVDFGGAPADVYLTTRTHVITALPRGQSGPSRGAIESLLHPRADARLRVAVRPGLELPASAAARFSGCTTKLQIALPVNVAKDGTVKLPLLASCSLTTLHFHGYGPLAFVTQVRTGEERWLGDHRLNAAGAVDVRVVRAPGSAPASRAVVRVLAHREPGQQLVPLAEQIAGEDGRVVMEGLPAGEELTLEARDGSTSVAGMTAIRLEPGQRAVVDPLEIPQPAALALRLKLDEGFKSENPKATIAGVMLERKAPPADRRTTNLSDGEAEAAFRNLAPGKWHVRAVVSIEGAAQPIDVTTVELRSGEETRLDETIKPSVFSGEVLSKGQGVAASVGISDEPGPNAIRRRVETAPDGSFKVLLPKAGLYLVEARQTVDRSALVVPTARRSADEASSIDIGPVAFDDPSRPVRIELPDGSISVRVQNGEIPISGADVVATLRLDNPGSAGLGRIVRRGRTDATGFAIFSGLREGNWIVEARKPNGGRRGEKTTALGRAAFAEVTLDLNDGVTFEGVIVDATGAPASGAGIDCSYFDGTTLRAIRTDAKLDGQFSATLAKPVPPLLQCGVTTVDGGIAAFTLRTGSRVTLALPPAAGSVRIADWGDRVIPDRFWLVNREGQVFNLSWAARKFGRPWAPLLISRMPAGDWAVVEADSLAALLAIGRGMAGSLAPRTRIQVEPGKSQEIHIQSAIAAVRR